MPEPPLSIWLYVVGSLIGLAYAGVFFYFGTRQAFREREAQTRGRR